MKGIHTFKKDHINQTSSCSPWGLQVHPFPSLVKKMEAYLEERRNITDPFPLTCNYPDRPIRSPCMRSQTPKRKKTKNLKKRSRKVNHQASRKQYKVKLEEPFSLSKAAKSTFILASAPTTKTPTTTTTAFTPPTTSNPTALVTVTTEYFHDVQNKTLSIQS